VIKLKEEIENIGQVSNEKRMKLDTTASLAIDAAGIIRSLK